MQYRLSAFQAAKTSSKNTMTSWCLLVAVAIVCTLQTTAKPTENPSNGEMLEPIQQRFDDMDGLYSKRAPPMSINQDMQHLADIYNNEDQSGSTQALLNRLGKRAPSMSINQDLQTLTGKT